MQSDLSSPWFEESDPDTIEIVVGIEGVGIRSHEIPVSFLEQEFSSDETRRQFIEDQLQSMALSTSIVWREQQ